MDLNHLNRTFLILILVCIAQRGIGQSIPPTNTTPAGLGVAPIGWWDGIGSIDVSNQLARGGGVSLWEGTVENPPNDHEVWLSGFGFESAISEITGLTIGETYLLRFYMAELSDPFYLEDPTSDGVLSVEIEGEIYLFPFTGGFDNSWTEQTVEFTATAEAMEITVQYYIVSYLFWNVSFSGLVELACDSLITTVSATEVCLGDEVTLSAESINDGVVTWDGGLIDGEAFIPPLGTSTYTATSNVEEDCVFEVSIEVYDFPTFEVAASDDEICEGEFVVFTVDGEAEAFIWDTPGITLDSPYFPSDGYHLYELTGINGSCETVVEIAILVLEGPTVLAAIDDSTICLGETVVFSGSGADLYSWDLGVENDLPYTPMAVGSTVHTITGIDTISGCSSSDDVILNVYALPIVSAAADFDTICEGDMVTLSGSGAASYDWDLGVEDGMPFAPPIGTTTYSVMGTSLVGCIGTASIDITVHPLPIVTILASDTVLCEGEELILSGEGAVDYLWDSGIIDGEAFIPAELGIVSYSVTGISEEGCEATAAITIEILPRPTVVALASSADICEGESLVLTGSGADTYEWEDGVLDGIAFIPDGPGTFEYTVIGTDEFTMCSSVATVSVIVHSSPEITASASLSELCLGESVILNGMGGETYVWDGGVTDGVSFTPPGLGTYTYTVIGTDSHGCEGTATISITVDDCSPLEAGFILPSAICAGDCVILQDTTTGSVVEWAWNFGGIMEPNTSSLQNPTLCANASGIFAITLTATSANGAVSVVTNELIVYPNPIIEATSDTIIDQGGTANLIANSPSFGDFIWTPSLDVDCPVCSITTAQPGYNQVFTVEIIDANGCSAKDSIHVFINPILSVGVADSFSPNGDGINDVLHVKGEGLREVSFIIYNRYGERVFETNDQEIGWDGTFRNLDQNPGVFTWVLFYTTEDGKRGQLNGNTSLVR